MRKLLAAVSEEVDMAVISPGARERMIAGAGMQRGTVSGELWRSLFLFKSFPISVMMRHWSRAMGMPSAGGRAAYLAAFLASTTILGAMSQQISDMITGKIRATPLEKRHHNFGLTRSLKAVVWDCMGIFCCLTTHAMDPVRWPPCSGRWRGWLMMRSSWHRACH